MKGHALFQEEMITNLKITGPISTKIDSKHSWVKGIHVCSNEGLHLSPRGDDNGIAKIH